MPEGPKEFNWAESLPGPKRLVCPHCRERTLSLIHFLFKKAWEPFECPNCRATVIQSLRTRVFEILAIGLAAAPVFYTFPWMSEVIDSVEGQIARFLVRFFLPMIVISVQALVLYTPLVAVVWFSGELDLVEPPQ